MSPSLGVWGYPPILLSHSFLIITITIPWGPWSLDNGHFSLSLCVDLQNFSTNVYTPFVISLVSEEGAHLKDSFI